MKGPEWLRVVSVVVSYLKSSWAIMRQYIKEFSLAATSAVAWTAYNFLSTGRKLSAVDAITVFAGAFFIIAWVTGNFFRIKKQGADRAYFEKITDLLTGGNSYPSITTVISGGGPSGLSYPISLLLTIQGAHSLFDVTVTVTDLIKLVDVQKANPMTNGSEYQTRYQLGTVGRSYEERLNRILDMSADKYDFSIVSVARNGVFFQLLRLVRVNGEWFMATRITKENTVLYEYAHPRFPTAAMFPGVMTPP